VRGCDLSADAYSDAAEPSKLKKKRNPDTDLHLDNEEDTLYNDWPPQAAATITRASKSGAICR
jgi:hypothetical protein